MKCLKQFRARLSAIIIYGKKDKKTGPHRVFYAVTNMVCWGKKDWNRPDMTFSCIEYLIEYSYDVIKNI